jgi:hypothetical protein
VPLCDASWHAIVNEKEIVRGVVGLAFGIPIGVLGLTFHWWKTRLRWAADAAIYWWPISVVLVFLYVAGPEIFRRSEGPPHSRQSVTHIAKAPAPVQAVVANDQRHADDPQSGSGDTTKTLSATKRQPREVVHSPPSSQVTTSLRLQFNASGTKPQEIEARNVEWTWLTPVEKRQIGVIKKSVCENSMSTITANSTATTGLGVGLGLGLGSGLSLGSHGCVYPQVEEFPQYEDVKNWVLFLVFLSPTQARDIKVDSHGAALPKWEKYSLSERKVYLLFQGDLKNMVLAIDVVD